MDNYLLCSRCGEFYALICMPTKSRVGWKMEISMISSRIEIGTKIEILERISGAFKA